MTRQKSPSFSSSARTRNTQPWMPALCDVTEGTNTRQNSPGRCRLRRPPPRHFCRLAKTRTVQRNISVWRQAVNTGLNMTLSRDFWSYSFQLQSKAKLRESARRAATLKLTKERRKEKHARVQQIKAGNASAGLKPC